MRALDRSMPVRLVAESVDMHPTCRRFARESLPNAAGVAMGDGDLEAVGREPARVIEIFVAVAAAAARTSHDDRSRPQIADDAIGPRIRRRRVLANIREVATVWGNEEILIRRPDIIRNRTRFDAMFPESQTKYLTLRCRRILRHLHEPYHERIAHDDWRRGNYVADGVCAESRRHGDTVNGTRVFHRLPRFGVAGIDDLNLCRRALVAAVAGAAPNHRCCADQQARDAFLHCCYRSLPCSLARVDGVPIGAVLISSVLGTIALRPASLSVWLIDGRTSKASRIACS